MLNSSVGAAGEWLSAGGENGFPQELVQIVAEAPSVGKLSTFLFPPTADSHREVKKQCFFFFFVID